MIGKIVEVIVVPIKIAVVILFSLVTVACSGDKKTTPAEAWPDKGEESKVLDVQKSLICEFPNVSLPDDAVIFAAGAYTGRKIDFQIDQSGENASQIDVVVNSTKAPVVLMLGAYDPTIWNIRWTAETKIVAVLASGYHRQVLAGLTEEIPTLICTDDNRHPCGYFYVTSEKMGTLNPYARRLFQRPVDMVYPAEEGAVVIGAPIPDGMELMTSSSQPPESFRDQGAPLAGLGGLEEAVRKGFLRRATQENIDSWVDTVLKEGPERDVPPIAGQGAQKPAPPPLENAYVVLKPFTYPGGLYSNPSVFLVPKGIAKPTGNPGHSAVYDFNTLQCEGALCRSN